MHAKEVIGELQIVLYGSHSVCEVFIYSFNQQVVIEHLCMLDSILDPKHYQ